MSPYPDWTSKDDEILIDFVRVHDILYNIKHKDYRNIQMKQKLWCEVGNILNKTDTDCNKRWSYVRDYYIRRKVKHGTGSSGEAARKRSDLLSFLDSIPSSQKNRITIVMENTPHGSEQTPFNTHYSSEQILLQKQETEEITFNNEEDIGTDTYYNNDSEVDSNNDEDIDKKLAEDGNMTSNQKQKYKSHSQKRLNPQNELDENDLFFSSMAKIVKKLPRYEQAQIRMQIGSLVGNAELRHISIDSPHSH